MADPKETVVTDVAHTADLPPAEEAALVVIYGQDLGRKFDLTESGMVVGRAPESNICLDQEAVSRTHARIVTRDEQVVVEDLGSTNGTFVNDDRIAAPRALANGDILKIGRTILKFIAGGNIEASYHAEVFRLTTIDGLTQVFNRRYFEETLAREVSRCRRYGRALSLVMMDVDRFKGINDTHGHLAGDYVLKQTAAVAKAVLRREDVLARYGGEEFALLLPELETTGAVAVAEKIRTRVAAEHIAFDGRTIPVTLSLGVATLGAEDRGVDLVQAADARLYEAKGAGRNCVRALGAGR